MEKQVLYPIVTASGKEITRGYPINPRPFERTDHPHHGEKLVLKHKVVIGGDLTDEQISAIKNSFK